MNAEDANLDEARVSADDRSYDCTFLALATTVLVLAAVLQLGDGEGVVLPIARVRLPDTCWFRRATGVDCPGCGLTRCFVAIAHGDFGRAWRFNPAGYLFFAIVASQIPYRLLRLRRRRRASSGAPSPWVSSSVAIVLAISLLLQWAWRLANP